MSSEIAICVENLSKRYRIGVREKVHDTLAGTLVDWVKRPGQNLRRLHALTRFSNNGAEDDVIWALKDVSFEVQQGEVVGVIGRNGAGKSTLLKILSRITQPTSGRVELHGRVSSLLEVGTGFHPELTGRENIYLNGTILGMTRREIDKKFDEIVDFSGVEKFIDTPVKRYSSGMAVRLAFSVAAYLEPEILLVDEVLAVGDAEFQKKCLGKMGEVAKGGRTVLFVSHNMAAVTQLCPKAVLISSGRVQFNGKASKAVEQYLRFGSDEKANGRIRSMNHLSRSGTGQGKIVEIELKTATGQLTSTFGIGEPIIINIKFISEVDLPSLVAGVEIRSMLGIALLNLRSDSQGLSFGPIKKGEEFILQLRIPGLPLYPGSYSIEPWLAEKRGKRIDHLHDILKIYLEPKGNYLSEVLIQEGRGFVLLDCEWASEIASNVAN